MRCRNCHWYMVDIELSNTGLPKRVVDLCTCTERHTTAKEVNKDYWHLCPHFHRPTMFGFRLAPMVKQNFQLMSYTTDIRKVLTDKSVKDISEEEDKRLKEIINAEL